MDQFIEVVKLKSSFKTQSIYSGWSVWYCDDIHSCFHLYHMLSGVSCYDVAHRIWKQSIQKTKCKMPSNGDTESNNKVLFLCFQ
jgi:hypothetical protein